MTQTIIHNNLFAAACFTYMLSGLFCGYTRWNHLCRPFDKEADNYYPCRRQMTFFYLAQILQFPYLLNPIDSGTWLFIKIFSVIYYPMCFSMLIPGYFRKQRPIYHRLDITSFIVVFAFLLCLLAMTLIPESDFLTRYERVLLWTAGATGLLFTARLLQTSLWVKRKIDLYHINNFSNDEDFPLKFAEDTLWSILIWVLIMDSVFITDNRWIKFACDIVCTLWQVYFLTKILHPQFPYNIADDNNTESSDNVVQTEEDEQDLTAARAMVLEVMLKKYKNPHLQKSEVLEAIPKGMKSDANAFILQIGYYNLVNMFRLQHAILYRDSKPSATQDDIAGNSGFISRYAFYRARKNVEHIDKELVSGVKL